LGKRSCDKFEIGVEGRRGGRGGRQDKRSGGQRSGENKGRPRLKGAKRLAKSTRDAQMSDGILRLGRFSHSTVERVCQLLCFVEMLMNETGSDEEEKGMNGGGESSKEEVGMKGEEGMKWDQMRMAGYAKEDRVKVISALRTNRRGMGGHVGGEST